ncbi:MAG TPA: shikimate dehydrogenase [Rhodospirillales bacterium]|jgi:shikimate dehydrogenase
MTISGKAKLAGVIGWPVGHSLSPRLHGYWLAEHGIDGAYVPLPVRPEDCRAALRMLPKLGFVGVNVTVPHKQSAAKAVDTLDAVATRTGAVNTVVVEADGRLAGSNTDGFGFLENLKAGAKGWKASAGAVVIIGAGGAARAIAAALLDAGAPEVRIVNRTPARAEALANDIGGAITAAAWPDRAKALTDAALLVNATSLGMKGKGLLDLDLGPLPKDAIVADIVYAPLETPLLKVAATRGHKTVDGLGMLLHQARPGFHCWFGVEPKVTAALREFVLEGLDG